MASAHGLHDKEERACGLFGKQIEGIFGRVPLETGAGGEKHDSHERSGAIAEHTGRASNNNPVNFDLFRPVCIYCLYIY